MATRLQSCPGNYLALIDGKMNSNGVLLISEERWFNKVIKLVLIPIGCGLSVSGYLWWSLFEGVINCGERVCY